MNATVETQASVKNGVSRMIFAVISILLEVAVILLLLFFAGPEATWIYAVLRFLPADRPERTFPQNAETL